MLTTAESRIVHDLETARPRNPRRPVQTHLAPPATVDDAAGAPILRFDVGFAPTRRSIRHLEAPIQKGDRDAIFATLFARQRSGALAHPASGGIEHLSFIVVVGRVAGIPVGSYLVQVDGACIGLSPLPQALGDCAIDEFRLRTGADGVPSMVVLPASNSEAIDGAYSGCTLATSLIDSGVFLGRAHSLLAQLDMPSCIVSIAQTSVLRAHLSPRSRGWLQLAAIAIGGKKP